MSEGPEVAVVVATFNRAERLRDLLEALRRQTYPADRFEVVVVNDASIDGTASLLERELERADLRLTVISRKLNGGRATARDDGWRKATAELIAFTDDDCVPTPGWLVAGTEAAARNPGAIVQGRTDPTPGELERLGPLARPFARTISVPEFDPALQTCNVFYPRSLVERIDGFDTGAFGRAPGGEDSDLAWRAIATGAGAVFAEDARVHHAVNPLGPIGKLRFAARWDMKVYTRHPELRRRHFTRGIFWKETHYLLLRALAGVPLRSRWGLLRAWLAYPYLRSLYARAKIGSGSRILAAPLAPYFLLHDLTELYAVLRTALRYRTPML